MTVLVAEMMIRLFVIQQHTERLRLPPAEADQICLIMCDASLKYSPLSSAALTPASCQPALLTGCNVQLDVTGTFQIVIAWILPMSIVSSKYNCL